MFRSILTVAMLVGLVGCAQTAKKTETPPETKATDNKAAPTPAKESKDAKATAKETKASKTKEAKAEKTEAKPAPTPAGMGVVTCESGSVKRIITVKAVEKGCETLYEKDGATKVEGKSQSGLDYCNRVQEKIKNNLMSAGFKCS